MSNAMPAPDWLMPDRVGYAGGGDGSGASSGVQYAEEEDEEEDDGDDEDNGDEEDDGDDEDEEDDEEEDEGDDTGEETLREQRGWRNDLILPAAVAAFLVICAVLLWYRRKRYLRRLRQMETPRLFYRLLKLLHRTESLRAVTGMEPDFEERLRAEFSCFTETETAELMRIVKEAAYGPERPDGEDGRRTVYAFYERTAAELYGRMRLPGRLYCTWILNIR
ncbi:MAG: hypothetical protein NC079_05930 [Clostridium sp.]|nr:hypothetical protein [Acetatifactor muris]MCM1526969.1 hypothetical protein [Bacteroides sp.]MCM1563132.1 hypothetical protein [Clostridium sp.]